MPNANSPELVLEFRDVSLGLDEQEVLRDVSLKLHRAETKVVLGGAGSGKSVLLKTALGLFRPDGGAVLVFGQDITRMSEEQLYAIREKIGMVFQESALFDSLAVAENVAYAFQEARALPPEEEEERVRRALRFVGLEEARDKLPSELSGGMRHRVAIARAIVTEPPLMLYDSPTAGLDPVTAQSIITLIIKLSNVQRVDSLMVTHRLQDVRVLADFYYDQQGDSLQPAHSRGHEVDTETSFLVLEEGRVAFDGNREELARARDPYVRKFVA